MTDPAVEYLVPASVDEAIRLRCRHGSRSRFISGGTEVVPLMTRGRLAETCLIELSRLDELCRLAAEDGGHLIGAAVTLARLQQSPLVGARWTALAEAAGSIREPQVRNRGTLGGNVAHGVPSADLVPALLALEAQVVLAGPDGRRRLALADFLQGPYRTALEPDELLIALHLPDAPAASGSAFLKLTRFGGSGLSVANAAAAVALKRGRIAQVRLAIGAAGPMPCRVPAAEILLQGRVPDDGLFAEAGQMAAEAAAPRDGSIRATPAHRRRVLKTLAARALALAAARASQARNRGMP